MIQRFPRNEFEDESEPIEPENIEIRLSWWIAAGILIAVSLASIVIAQWIG